jgi:hypothetical protein
MISKPSSPSLAACGGTAAAAPAALRGLLTATNRDEQQRYYWQLENVVVVQGNLFEAAVPVASVLCAALLDELTPAARGRPSQIAVPNCGRRTTQD